MNDESWPLPAKFRADSREINEVEGCTGQADDHPSLVTRRALDQIIADEAARARDPNRPQSISRLVNPS
jgi:hypothetical protein